jgi:NAD(P)-dependent dehydrogenase (short-subunit alcohol dehydrogenase family)
MSSAVDDRPVCLVTGAGGRLGSAFCREFADRYEIAAIWHRRRPLAATAEQSLVDPLDPDRPLPVNAHPVTDFRADLCREGAAERLVDKVLAHFGRVDVLLNLAVAGRWTGLLAEDYTLDEATATLRLNVAAPLALTAAVCRAAWLDEPEVNRDRNRCVVNVSSTASVYVYPGFGQGMYSASKAALNILSRHMAAEFAPIGIRVNVLAPDSFPGRLPIRSVLSAMSRLIDGDATGQILLQHPGGVEHVLEG